MNATFASLPEGFFTSIDATNKWFLTRMGVIMFGKVLLQCKMLTTFITNVFLVNFMDFHMAFKAVLGLKMLFASNYVAFKSFA